MSERNISSRSLILLPTYNEKNNINLIIPKIYSLLPEINILVIDDNSPDKTAEAAAELARRYPKLRILKRPAKTGLGDAYKDGMRRIFSDEGIEFIITMDADGSHSPEYLESFLREMDHYDLVIGSRYVRGGGTENWELWRKKLSSFGNFSAKLLTGLKINDFTAGFMCVRKEYLKKVNFNDIDSSGYSFLIELKFSLIKGSGARVKELPIIFKNRIEGESKINKKIILEGLKTLGGLLFKRLRRKKS